MKSDSSQEVDQHVDAAERLVGDGALDVPSACTFTGLGRTFLYQMMDAGKLRYAKVGKRRLIPKAELIRVLVEGLVGMH